MEKEGEREREKTPKRFVCQLKCDTGRTQTQDKREIVHACVHGEFWLSTRRYFARTFLQAEGFHSNNRNECDIIDWPMAARVCHTQFQIFKLNWNWIEAATAPAISNAATATTDISLRHVWWWTKCVYFSTFGHTEHKGAPMTARNRRNRVKYNVRKSLMLVSDVPIGTKLNMEMTSDVRREIGQQCAQRAPLYQQSCSQ